MKTLHNIIFTANLILILSLTACGVEPLKKEDLARNPLCYYIPQLESEEEWTSDFFKAGCEIKYEMIQVLQQYQNFYITYKDLGNGFIRYGHIYQTNLNDKYLPYAPYYDFVPSSGFEFGTTWDVYVGKRPKKPDISNEIDRYSEVLKYKNIKRSNLPITVQEVINTKIGLKQEKINTKDLIIGLAQTTKEQASISTANVQAMNKASEIRRKQYDAHVQAIESKDHQEALAILATGVAMIADTNIERKRMKQQKKAAQQAQIQAQRDYSSQKLSEYDRQYVKHDAPRSQNQSSGNYGVSSDNSNSSNTNQQTRPHQERKNLPSQTGCISMGKSNKQDPTHDTRWFLLKNSCAYPVHVTWCDGQGCVNSSFASDIPSGGADEVWAKKDNDGKIHVNLMACQESSGNDEVFTDWPNKQCWANIEMQ